ncbi:Histone-lysine N-methyltransferase SETMAR, partial [Dufourea novaeangliae]
YKILNHPLYSPDIAPSDYHLFLAVYIHLRNRQFQDRHDVERESEHFFDATEANFYKKGIEKLLHR